MSAYLPILGPLALAIVGLTQKAPDGPMWPRESLDRWRNGWNWNISCGLYTVLLLLAGGLGLVLMLVGDVDGDGSTTWGESPMASIGLVLWAGTWICVLVFANVQFWVALVCGIRANMRKPTRMWPTIRVKRPA